MKSGKLWKHNTMVRVKNTGGQLDGRTGLIRGRFGDYPEIAFYIVEFNVPIDKFGYTSLVMISTCLEEAK